MIEHIHIMRLEKAVFDNIFIECNSEVLHIPAGSWLGVPIADYTEEFQIQYPNAVKSDSKFEGAERFCKKIQEAVDFFVSKIDGHKTENVAINDYGVLDGWQLDKSYHLWLRYSPFNDEDVYTDE